MIELIKTNLAIVEGLCQRYKVLRLEVFGSAASENWDPAHSDLDFLVQFAPCEPRLHYDRYFGLLEGLQTVFARPVDLVEADAMRNPYFIKSIQPSRRLLYAA